MNSQKWLKNLLHYYIKMKEIIRIVYKCENCGSKKIRKGQGKEDFYENKDLIKQGLIKCRRCEEIKTLDNFSLVTNNSNRYRRQCRKCVSKRQMENRKKRKLEKEKNHLKK